MERFREVPLPEELLRRRAWIRTLAGALVADPARADDVAQDAWIASVAHPPERSGALKGWLRNVVRNRAVDEMRSTARRGEREKAAARREDSVRRPQDLVLEAEMQQSVAAAVCALEEPYRTTVLLRHFEELTIPQIAARESVPVETVRTRLRRAHEQLRARLDAEHGKRDRWAVLLTGIAERKVAGTTAAGLAVAGALAMKVKIAVACVALVLLVGGGVAWVSMEPAAAPAVAVARAAAVPAAVPAASSAATASVHGVVRRKLGGAVVPGAVVRIGEGTAATDAAGAYRIDGVREGRVHVVAQEAEVRADADLDVRGATFDAGTLWLDTFATVTVRVVDEAGRPVPGADVRMARVGEDPANADTNSYLKSNARGPAVRPWDASLVSDAQGVAVFELRRFGGVRVVASAPGRAGTQDIGWLRPGTASLTLTVRMTAAHVVRGRVVHADGSPAPGLQVVAGDAAIRAATTDASGGFETPGVAAGACPLAVALAHASPLVLATIDVPRVDEVELRLPPTGALEGRVTDGDGAPLADAEVLAEVNTERGRVFLRRVTARDGAYRFDAVPQGRVAALEAVLPGWTRVAGLGIRCCGRDFTWKGVDSLGPWILAADPTRIDVTLVRGGTFRGRLVDDEGPVPGAALRILRDDPPGMAWRATGTGEDGRFEIAGLAPGTYAIAVTDRVRYQPGVEGSPYEELRKGRLPAVWTVEIAGTAVVERELRMARGPAVRGRVIDADGHPVAGVTVAEDRDLGSPSAISGSDGGFVLSHVRPAQGVPLAVRGAGLVAAAPVRVDVPVTGEPAFVEIRVVPAPRVAGVVQDAAGAPLAGAQVRWRQTEPYASGAEIADEAGRFTIVAQRSQNPLVLVASAAGFAADDERKVAVGVAEPVAITLARGRLVAGRIVVRGSGVPAEGAAVSVVRSAAKRAYSFGTRSGNFLGGETAVACAITDAQGSFAIEGVSEDGRGLLVESPRFVDGLATLPAGDVRGLVVEVDEALPLAGVVWAREGERAAGVTVFAEVGPGRYPDNVGAVTLAMHSGTSAMLSRLVRVTDSAGRFRFDEVPSGQVSLVAHGVSFGPFDSGATDLRLVLDRPVESRIRGRVVRSDGTALAQAVVRADPLAAMGTGPRTIADAQGRFEFTSLTYPAYLVSVRGGDKGSVSRRFQNVLPSDEERTYVYEPGMELRGRLAEATGSPIANVRLVVRPVNSAPGSILPVVTAITDEQGRFAFADLLPGEWAVDCDFSRLPGDKVRYVRIVSRAQFAAGTTDAEIEGRLGGRASGVVVQPDGTPRRNTVLWLRAAADTREAVPAVTDGEGAFEATGLREDADYFCDLPKSKTSFRAGQTDVRIVLLSADE